MGGARLSVVLISRDQMKRHEHRSDGALEAHEEVQARYNCWEIILAITRGARTKDARWEGVLNSTMRIAPSGRRLRVVYKLIGPRKYRIITAYWLYW
jgi:hypothetical protein